MPTRFPLTIGLAILAAAGCHKLPLLAGPPAAAPVLVVPEPPIAVPVPLGPGETLVENHPQPFYLAPGVAPPPQAVQPLPRGPLSPAQPRPPSLLDRIGNGGAISPKFGLPAAPVVGQRRPNPLVVPVANAELAWDEIADVVSDLFPIQREQPVQFIDGVLTEGFIETAPQIGATLLEPQRHDSVGAFNRWQSTLQTIRRRVVLRVTPTAGGWAVAAEATKELEDLPQPLGATAGAASLRNDNALPTARLNDDFRVRMSERWIALGRDEPLEQELLCRIEERLAGRRR